MCNMWHVMAQVWPETCAARSDCHTLAALCTCGHASLRSCVQLGRGCMQLGKSVTAELLWIEYVASFHSMATATSWLVPIVITVLRVRSCSLTSQQP